MIRSLVPLSFSIFIVTPHVANAAFVTRNFKNAIAPVAKEGYHPLSLLQQRKQKNQPWGQNDFVLRAKKDDEDDGQKPGMEDAFRQLEALESLGDEFESSKEKQAKESIRKEIKAEVASDVKVEEVSIEKEIEVYKEMAMESDKNDEEVYADVLLDMGGSPKKKEEPLSPEKELEQYKNMVKDEDSEVYSDIMADMGGTSKSTSTPSPSDDDEDTPTTLGGKDSATTEEFMNQALEDAVKEVKLKTPEELGKLSDNILDDKEIMKEIEKIFEQGNEKLLESLEDIRKEQQLLAQADAAKRNQDRTSEEAERLAKAEVAMAAMLDKVNKETSEVEKAVEDLKKAQSELSGDPMMKLANLKEGGIIKQGAVVGSLLFSLRTVAELLASTGIDGESHLVAAVIQGAIAIICIAYVFLF